MSAQAHAVTRLLLTVVALQKERYWRVTDAAVLAVAITGFAPPVTMAANAVRETLVYTNSNTSQLGVAHTDGSGARDIGADSQPALAPDGRQIAYTSCYGCGNGAEIRLVGVDGMSDRLLYSDGPSGGGYSTPVWSPDGSHVTFRSNGQGSLISGFYSISVTGTTPLALGIRYGANPSYTPGGELLFDSDTDPSSGACADSECDQQVFVRSTSGAFRQLTHDDATLGLEQAVKAQASPNGNKIVFIGKGSSNRDNLGVFTINFDGSNLTSVTGPGEYYSATFSPDGQRLLISAGGDDYTVVSSTLDGSVQTPILAGALEPAVRQPSPGGEDRFLANVFRPVLRFDEGEHWRPLSVDRFFGERTSSNLPLHSVCSATMCQGLANAETLQNFPTSPAFISIQPPVPNSGGPDYAETDYTSPRSQCVQNGLLDCDDGENTAGYYQTTLRSSGYDYIDYWFFYRYNDFPGIGDHEGDWEGLTVAPSTSHADTFDFVSFAQHTRRNSYLRGTLTCDDGDLCGTPTGFDPNSGIQLQPGGQRVWGYVASGSHATYPTSCTTLCTQDAGGPETFFPETAHGGEEPWGANDDSTRLLPLPTAVGWSGSGGKWTDWPGHWGGSGTDGDASPDSPGNQRRFKCPWEGNPDDQTACTAARSSRISPDRALGRCGSWIGGSVLAAACTPALLRRSVGHARLGADGRLRFAVSPSRARADSAPGIAQAVGPVAQRGFRLKLRGRVVKQTFVYVRYEAGRSVKLATFKLRPSRRNVATIAIKARGARRSVARLWSGLRWRRPISVLKTAG